jgi:hypothetical protein
LAEHEDSEYDDVWYSRHQREKEEQPTEALNTKTDKLKFQSLFESLARSEGEEGLQGEEAGLFDGMGMFGDCGSGQGCGDR